MCFLQARAPSTAKAWMGKSRSAKKSLSQPVLVEPPAEWRGPSRAVRSASQPAAAKTARTATKPAQARANAAAKQAKKTVPEVRPRFHRDVRF
jgi:hypothetical protein